MNRNLNVPRLPSFISNLLPYYQCDSLYCPQLTIFLINHLVLFQISFPIPILLDLLIHLNNFPFFSSIIVPKLTKIYGTKYRSYCLGYGETIQGEHSIYLILINHHTRYYPYNANPIILPFLRYNP